jgi:hypothetical protein
MHVMYALSRSSEILAFMPAAAEAAARAQSADQQPLPQPQVEAANQQPGLKVQRLVSALWNLDRVDQRTLPLDGSFSYGTATAAGTGMVEVLSLFLIVSVCQIKLAAQDELHPGGQAHTASWLQPFLRYASGCFVRCCLKTDRSLLRLCLMVFPLAL